MDRLFHLLYSYLFLFVENINCRQEIIKIECSLTSFPQVFNLAALNSHFNHHFTSKMVHSSSYNPQEDFNYSNIIFKCSFFHKKKLQQ